MGLSEEKIELSRQQINLRKQDVKYDTRDYVIKYLIEQFNEGEFFIPIEYQRQFIWKQKDKCKFIESILMGLPIPFMFFSDSDDGRIEIVDGAQRTQTLVEFANNDLELNGLTVLDKSNGFKFRDLDISIQRRFLNTNIRVVYLDSGTTIPVRQEIFNRINTSGLSAKSSEIRRGSSDGKFSNFLSSCTHNELFNKLAPRTAETEKRYEGLELATRFFAYSDNYEEGLIGYTGNVSEYMDKYVKSKDKEWENPKVYEEQHPKYLNRFTDMLFFAQNFLGDQGFRKTPTSKSTPRARFEALSIGIYLAIKSKPDLSPQTKDWLNNPDFLKLIKSDAANNKSKLFARINYVKEHLLKD